VTWLSVTTLTSGCVRLQSRFRPLVSVGGRRSFAWPTQRIEGDNLRIGLPRGGSETPGRRRSRCVVERDRCVAAPYCGRAGAYSAYLLYCDLLTVVVVG
jgi:hypothetical protein